MSRGGAEREGDRIHEAGPRLWAVSTEPDSGLEPMNHKIMTWARVGGLTDWATQVPLSTFYLFFKVYLFILKKRERKQGMEQRERRENSTESDVGLDLTNSGIMTWTEIKSQTLTWLSHSGTPQIIYILMNFVFIYRKHILIH